MSSASNPRAPAAQRSADVAPIAPAFFRALELAVARNRIPDVEREPGWQRTVSVPVQRARVCQPRLDLEPHGRTDAVADPVRSERRPQAAQIQDEGWGGPLGLDLPELDRAAQQFDAQVREGSPDPLTVMVDDFCRLRAEPPYVLEYSRRTPSPAPRPGSQPGTSRASCG